MATFQELVTLANDFNCTPDGAWERIEDMYLWIESASACYEKFMEDMGIDPDSWTGQAVESLTFENLLKLEASICPDDNLIHLDADGFTVNYGSVGSQGIRTEFSHR